MLTSTKGLINEKVSIIWGKDQQIQPSFFDLLDVFSLIYLIHLHPVYHRRAYRLLLYYSEKKLINVNSLKA